MQRCKRINKIQTKMKNKSVSLIWQIKPLHDDIGQYDLYCALYLLLVKCKITCLAKNFITVVYYYNIVETKYNYQGNR